jgi:hypothetical protein
MFLEFCTCLAHWQAKETTVCRLPRSTCLEGQLCAQEPWEEQADQHSRQEAEEQATSTRRVQRSRLFCTTQARQVCSLIQICLYFLLFSFLSVIFFSFC